MRNNVPRCTYQSIFRYVGAWLDHITDGAGGPVSPIGLRQGLVENAFFVHLVHLVHGFEVESN